MPSDLPAPVPRAWVLVGHYFRVLAFVSILTVLASFIHSKSIRLDLGFILLFWIGAGLIEGRKWPWRFAVGLSALVLVGTLVHLIEGLAFSGPASGWFSSPQDSRLFIIVAVGVNVLLFLPPLMLLLRPSLIPPAPAESTDPLRWTGERFRAYLLGALLLGAINAGQMMLTGKHLLMRTTRSHRLSTGLPAMMVVSKVHEEGDAAPLFISSWALGNTNSVHMSDEVITLGSTPVRLPDVRVGQYLRLLESPAEPVDQPNILLVMADGSILRVQRRVTLQNLAAVEVAISSAADMNEVKTQIEKVLPSVSGRFP